MAMLDYIGGHSHRFFAEHLSGDIASKVDDIRESATRIMQLFLSLFIPSFVAILIATSIYTHFHPLFGLVVFTWSFLHLSICIFFAKKCNLASDLHSESKSHLNGQVVDGFANMSTVRLFSATNWERRRLYSFQQDEQKKHENVLGLIFKIRLLLGVICISMMGIVMLFLMVSQWQKGRISAADLGYIFYSGWGICVMAWISGIELPNLFKEIGKCRQALRPIQEPHEIVDHPDALPIRVVKGEIIFDHVTFFYHQKNNLFHNKDVVIKAGSKVGLVGFSGSGKTTFVNLMFRFFELESGQILIDGQDIATVTQASLHSQITMIPQDTSLFHRSLMENIRYGRLNATDEEVIEASKQAHCHEFICQLPEGYASLVGERGIKLSGGQRQRIAIARAILKNAPILILDEATSALDSITEAHIHESLQQLMTGRTTIVIAHRLSTLSDMDRILVFDQGRIVEDGTHEDLKTLGGHYAKLWAMQAGGFLPN
jgi:ATP-binding cassette subfamily B protein